MDTYLIYFIASPILFILSIIMYCLMDNGTNNSNGYHTRNNGTRNYSESKYSWEDVSNDDFDDSDDVVWGREDY